MNNPAQKSYQLYIGGEWVDASDGGTLDVYCPANGEPVSYTHLTLPTICSV